MNRGAQSRLAQSFGSDVTAACAAWLDLPSRRVATSSKLTADLVAAARGGDQAAYEQLFDHLADRLLLFIRLRLGARLGREHDAWDVLQETYVEAHRSFASFRPEGPQAFTRWLYGVADHRLRDLAKRAGARKRQPDQPLIRDSRALANARARQTGPSTACERSDAHSRLAEAMLELAEDERDVLLRRYFQEQTLDAIAEARGCSEASVRRLLGAARVRLGQRLNPA